MRVGWTKGLALYGCFTVLPMGQYEERYRRCTADYQKNPMNWENLFQRQDVPEQR